MEWSLISINSQFTLVLLLQNCYMLFSTYLHCDNIKTRIKKKHNHTKHRSKGRHERMSETVLQDAVETLLWRLAVIEKIDRLLTPSNPKHQSFYISKHIKVKRHLVKYLQVKYKLLFRICGFVTQIHKQNKHGKYICILFAQRMLTCFMFIHRAGADEQLITEQEKAC